MGKKIICIIFGIALLLTACTVTNLETNERQEKHPNQKNTIENNDNGVDGKERLNQNVSKEIKNSLTEENLIGSLRTREKLYFKKKRDYLEQEQGDFIAIKNKDEVSIIAQSLSSKPKINPAKDKFAFIDYIGFEVKGDLELYDPKLKAPKEITNMEEFKEGKSTVKDFEWVNDNQILLIIGYATGTITQGGDLYLLDIDSEDLKSIYKADVNEEIVDISIDGSKVIMKFIHWKDENYTESEYREENHIISNLLNTTT